MEIKFCRRCGTVLEDRGRGAFVCANGHRLFYKSSAASSVLLLNDRNELLVGIRALDPGKGCWDVIGGFCDYEEDYNAAMERELQEEAGLAPDDYTPLIYMFNSIDHYMWEGELQPVLSVLFWARVKGNPHVVAADDVAEVMWVPLKDVDVGKFSPDFKSIKVAVPMLQKIVS